MSEYWKSTPKYWCKHCATYVRDTPFERKQHESTGKHQGNLKRVLRGIQNEHEKGERDKEKAKAEVGRLNRVVGGSSSAAAAVASGSSPAYSAPGRKKDTSGLTASDQKRQWAQLAEMGIQVPDNFRAEMAMPGQWQIVSQRKIDSTNEDDTLNIGVRKRKLDGDEEDEAAVPSEKRRGWGSTTKRYPGQDDSDLDLDALLTTSILKKEAVVKSQPIAETAGTAAANPGSDAGVKNDTANDEDSNDETKDIARAVGIASAANPSTIKSENLGLERTTTVMDTPRDNGVPVFKKRKVKSKQPQGSS